MSEGRVLYNNASGIPITNANLRFDDPTVFRNSRLETNNIYVNNNIFVSGKIGIATANPRRELEVSGYAIINGNGSDSQANNEFGVNEPYDTLSIMSPSGIGTGGRMSIFFGLATVTNYPIARIVAGDVYGRTTLAFQTGIRDHLVERMRIHTNGYIGIGTPTPICAIDVNGDLAISGSSYLYKTFTFSAASMIQSGSFQLTFPSISTVSSATIDVEMTIMRYTTVVTTGIIKFTVYLSYYSGDGTGVFVNNISTILTNGLLIDPRTITSSSTATLVNVIIPYRYANDNNQQTVSVKYSIQGPYAYEINMYGIKLVSL